ncbi:MAG: hypothetical protein IPG12_17005 [Saprospiraceae bacterium]|nr:hypothetical protein [Saprospiraceae bacterium]
MKKLIEVTTIGIKNIKAVFLICTDPIAYSHHIDYSNSGKYCHGLRNCIKRGYEVKKLPEEEALKIREDPCDYCYGH